MTDHGRKASVRGVLVGLWSAASTPFWIHRRLGVLVAPPHREDIAGPPSAEAGDRGPVSGCAERAGRAGIRLLARVPFVPIRNTCLYRSVATCLALRRVGIPAQVRLGVRRGSDLRAHAWVVRPQEPEPPRRGSPDFTPLRSPARSDASGPTT